MLQTVEEYKEIAKNRRRRRMTATEERLKRLNEEQSACHIFGPYANAIGDGEARVKMAH